MKRNSRHMAAIAALIGSSLLVLAGGAQAMSDRGSHDSPLAQKVKTAIHQAVGGKSPDITVLERDGTVYLSGWARTESELHTALHVASGVQGVKRAVSDGTRLWSSRSHNY